MTQEFQNELRKLPWVIEINDKYIHHWRTASWRDDGKSKPEDFYRCETVHSWDKLNMIIMNSEMAQGLQMAFLRDHS